MNEKAYLQICYAAFLGKVIGVRLGAPVENWSAEEISLAYPKLNGYPVDYGVFAADDDTNGPLFLVRSVIDGLPLQSLSKKVADAMLNYIPDHYGFFWWGGTGIATEQTAYENLQAGIQPPFSGSIQHNGKTLAEQIGGQIFSDCWGYINFFDPEMAANMAEQAACVTHDGEGLQGARFIAAAIAAAPGAKNIREIIERALACLDGSSAYANMVCDILAFTDRHSSDWQACLCHIRESYGRERYGGVCHILPNAAVVLLALCYGGGNFSQTLRICFQCGMDTDCNCGNVGSIMGAYCGLDGIPEEWILPINDVMLCSSSLGYLNMGSVSGGARLFAAIAAAPNSGKLAGNKPDWVFNLPYETKGVMVEGGAARQHGGALHFWPESENARLYWHSYYLPGELYDARYEPSFAPLVYLGGTICFTLSADRPVHCAAYAKTDTKGTLQTECQTVESKTVIRLSLPAGFGTVLQFGIRVAEAMGADVVVHAVSFDHHADYEVRFADLQTDDYGERFAGGRHKVIRGFTEYSGTWSLQNGRLIGCADGERPAFITTGDVAFRVKEIKLRFFAPAIGGCYAVFAVRGGRRYYACGVNKNILELLSREDDAERILFRQPLFGVQEREIILLIALRETEIIVSVGNEVFRLPASKEATVFGGAVGMLIRGSGECWIDLMSVKA